MKTLELFSGCGGLATGLQEAGFDHVGLIEFNSVACRSLRANFPPSIVHECDIRSFDYAPYRDQVDVVAGGPPCQPFSLGGLAKAYNDERDMFPEAARAVSEVAPKAFLFENVKGLLRSSFREYFQYICLRLTYPSYVKGSDETWQAHLERLRALCYGKYDGLKYHVTYKLLNAVDYGVPQSRERVFIIGFRDDVAADWRWPSPTVRARERKTLGDAIGRLPSPPDQPTKERPDHFLTPGAKSYPGHTGSSLDKPCKTIKAGAHGVPGGENMIRFPDGAIRYLTVHEAKLVQTFPANYKIIGPWGEAMRQIGNAVPVELAKIVASRLRLVLSTAYAPHGRERYPEVSEGEPASYEFAPPPKCPLVQDNPL